MAETSKNPVILDSFDKKSLQQIAALENKVAAIYAELCKEVGVVAELYGKNVDLEKVFKLGDYPQLNKKVDEIIGTLHDRLGSAIVDGVTAQWQLANEKNDDLVRKVFGKDIEKLSEEQITRYFTSNEAALAAFLRRKDKGLGLSQKVWKYAKEAKVDIESTLELGIKTGQSASSIARDLKQHLKEPNRLFRRVRDKEGKLHLSKAAQAYHPGQGVYRSSYKNALRLAVTEANMAYRAADYERVQDFDFVVGIEVRLSNNHTLNGKPFYDICDELKGKYPKDFKFRGWHPFCYSKDSEVLTAQGWKKFADVTFEDSIISLNPETREVEYVGITAKQQYWYAGLMCRFYNKTLDCLVTPDHSMVYLNKRDGEIRYCQAKDYTKGKGGFYRSAMNSTQDRPHIRIGGSCYKFDAFCEFMGYWLSDGSLEHNSGVSISQNVGEKAREDIVECIKKLGFEPKLRNDRVLFYDAGFNAYLKQFGYSYTKYVPEEIKTASVRQIKIFLDAFIKCDGHERPCKSFVGNHGNVFASQNGEKMYFTTSPQMAGDLCECMLKIGHRPSIAVSEPHTAVKKDGTIIQGNKPHYSIRECSSVTSTVFNKEEVAYSDYVYDLTLERNHIMYIKRNGKCFWGSNCRCHSVTILKTREELMEDNKRILDGQEPTEDSVNSVNELPDNFKAWAVKNKSRILAADERGTLPYFITDNAHYIEHSPRYGVALGVKHGRSAKKEAIKIYQDLPAPALTKDVLVNTQEIAHAMGITETVRPMTFLQADKGRGNISWGKAREYSENCQSVVVVHEARLRGIDVTALGYNFDEESVQFELGEHFEYAWEHPKTHKIPTPSVIKGDTFAEIKNKLEIATKATGRYHIGINMENNVGHVLTCERLTEGNLLFYDPQCDEFINISEYEDYGIISFELLKVDKLLLRKEIFTAIARRL